MATPITSNHAAKHIPKVRCSDGRNAMEDENSLIPAMIAVFLGIGGALAAVTVVIVTVVVLV